MGGFGSAHPTFPRQLVGDTPRLSLRAIPRFGKSVDLRWENPQDPANALHAKLTTTAEGLMIETGGTSVTVKLCSWPMPRGRGGLHGVRLRMICPRCGASRDALHWSAGEWGSGSEWGCRGADCLNLSHACRHRERYCPAIRRRAKLLRKLVRVSPRGLQARLLRAQIEREEAAMLANLKRANRDLTKRVKRHDGRCRIDHSQ